MRAVYVLFMLDGIAGEDGLDGSDLRRLTRHSSGRQSDSLSPFADPAGGHER